MKKTLIATALLTGATGASAADIKYLDLLSQSQFRQVSEDLGSALSYKALSPAEPLGITGFDVGVEATVTSMKSADLLKTATKSGSSYSSLVVPKVHLTKGLPLGFDIGAFYGAVPTTNINLTGVELKYAFLEGGAATPAVAVRGTWTKLGGVGQLDFATKGLELTASKGFAMFTPYAGLGEEWIDSNPNAGTLKKESFTEARMYAGLNVNLGLTNLAFEADKTGKDTTWGAKLGFRW